MVIRVVNVENNIKNLICPDLPIPCIGSLEYRSVVIGCINRLDIRKLRVVLSVVIGNDSTVVLGTESKPGNIALNRITDIQVSSQDSGLLHCRWKTRWVEIIKVAAVRRSIEYITESLAVVRVRSDSPGEIDVSASTLDSQIIHA